MPWKFNGTTYDYVDDSGQPTAPPGPPPQGVTPSPDTPAPTGTPSATQGSTTPPAVPAVTVPSGATSTPGGPTLGGGWDSATGTSAILKKAFAQGLTGQAAVDWATANGAPQIAYYADRNQYGMPDGYYAAPNGSSLDLIQRSGSNYGGVQTKDLPSGALTSLASSIAAPQPTTKLPTPTDPNSTSPGGDVTAPDGSGPTPATGSNITPTVPGLNPVIQALLNMQARR